MSVVNPVLLFLHFLGLALGFSVSFGNIVMGGLIAKATPPERVVLGRFPPAISQLGRVGLALLWSTGLILAYTKWGGFAIFPWQFHVKLTAVVLLTITSEYIHYLERLVLKGDASAVARIKSFGKVASVLALTALLFAVLTFG
jgi:hypothetical protein